MKHFLFSMLLVCFVAGNSFGQSADLDQYRNGSAGSPDNSGSHWVNGNAGASNSHYVEGYSIPYRCVMTGIPSGTPITITFGYDVKHNDHYAIDFLTHYRRLDPHTPFSHPAEPIDPAAGTGLNAAVFSTFAIPAPASPIDGYSNNLPAAERVFTIYGGTISAITFVNPQADLTQSTAETQINVTFTSISSTAVLAWGGHIGSRLDWGYDGSGDPLSAGGISGSPYHMRTKSWTLGSLGNQDRSLSAGAVVAPPTCDISPLIQSLCSDGSFSITAQASGQGPYQYAWSGPNGYSNIINTGNSSSTITINNAQPANSGVYTVVITDATGQTASPCQANVQVGQTPICSIDATSTNGCPGGSSTYDAPAGMSSYAWVITSGSGTISGSNGSQSVTVLNGGSCSGSYTLELTIDLNGCTSTCSVTPSFQDNTNPSITCPADINLQCGQSSAPSNTGSATATDNCASNPQITYQDVSVTGCVAGSVDRTWTAEDDCGNQSTCVQHIRFVDTTPPQMNCPSDYTLSGDNGSGHPCADDFSPGPVAIFNPNPTGSRSPVGVDFRQPRNAGHPATPLDWTGGSLNFTQSEFYEGIGVPQRIIFTGIQPNVLTGTTHTLLFKHEAVKHQSADRHAYDFMMSWEQAVLTASLIGNSSANELQDLLSQTCNGGISADALNACNNNTYSVQTDIPDHMGNPPNHHGVGSVDQMIQCFESAYGNRTIEIVGNAPISNPSLVFMGYDGGPYGDNYAFYSLTWTSTSTDIMIKVAPRPAVGFGVCGYGSCWGAGKVNGAPYHFILELLDGKSLGRRDNQIRVEELDCNLNIPIIFGAPTANDICAGNINPVITTSDSITYPTANSIRHCRRWTATDNCNNSTQCTQCVTVECDPPVNNNGNGERIEASSLTGEMFSAYPNPFKNSVVIEFNSEINAHGIVEVFNSAGEKIATIFDGNTEEGVNYKTQLDAKGLAEGIYTYRITNGDHVYNGKLTLIK